MNKKSVLWVHISPKSFRLQMVVNGISAPWPWFSGQNLNTVVGRNPKQPPGMVLKPVVNNGINYQPQLVSRISEPSTVSYTWQFCDRDLFGMVSSREPFKGCWWPPTFGDRKVTLNHLAYIHYLDVSHKLGSLKFLLPFRTKKNIAKTFGNNSFFTRSLMLSLASFDPVC